MPPATNAVFATWKISTRESGVWVRYSSPRLASKMASAMWLPTGRPIVTPATTCAESAFGGGVVKLLVVENAQLRAAAASQAYPSTTTLVGKVAIAAARLRLNRRTTSVKVDPPGTVSNASRIVVSDASRTRNPIHEMPLGSVACTSTLQ